MVALYVLLFGQICVASCVLPIGSQPEQVHLSYPGVKGSMVITWTTLNATESIVEYGLWGGKLFTQSARGNCTTFVDGGSEKRKIYIHRVTLSELIPGFTYVYHCGSEAGWSDVLYFTALIESTSFSPKFALFGDMGNENPQSLARLQKETQVGMYDVILHIVLYSFFVHVNGLQSDKAQVTKPKIHISEYLQRDFAYDMHEDEGRIGDEFMKQIESIAAYVPYMTCPGNHEWAYNFSHYRSRFNMPGQTEGLWYSWNIGSAHIISFSTEVYFYLEYGLDLLFRQYEWLKGDLEVEVYTETLKRTNQRTGQRDPGSSPWHTDPCTAPTMTTMTAPNLKAMYDLDATTPIHQPLAWRTSSIAKAWTWSFGHMSTPMRGCGLCTITRCLMGALRNHT
ncbi:acid phosphatase type 7 isoform X3 [Electrophorus electricus]|uniref:acid phosphatase type 7 isoform X3 n=1 Tax=Electrophorus electricus TaxID=8005 RepID=UPI0015D03863|nr:acid phosphatase type 7 isoform X3 [Electrophorus electricus]